MRGWVVVLQLGVLGVLVLLHAAPTTAATVSKLAGVPTAPTTDADRQSQADEEALLELMTTIERVDASSSEQRGGFIFGSKKKRKKGRYAHQRKSKGRAMAYSKHDLQCVVCQYVVERIKGEMLMHGIGSSMPGSLPTTPLSDGTAPPVLPPVMPPTSPAAGGGDKPSFLQLQDTHAASMDAASARTGFIGGIVRGVRKAKGRFHGWANKHLGKNVPKSKRKRALNIRYYRPAQVRYANMYDGPMRAARRAQQRYENAQMYGVVYSIVEPICTQHMPKPFYGMCGNVIRKYQKIAQGLRWNDRPDAICMHTKLCNKYSYIRKNPHSVYRP